ncbi:sugar phosphate nucleotidyltransferase [Croceitalea rosinachiae]|uniref:Sugar phosphate nucleotidyltransferase n=1 Tax=Croceitalea rosinachiae TaxID=3075596 RepID=A0ABU3A8B6_9FLAO|nr:sugar phosphate nucleotidyltransferase [Croceitalea sp. F388]MDT0606432.1 sugar phosphate nucleotidyltransferase [Croceitalea sp. F388]
MNQNLIILAGGVSSRMKKQSERQNLSSKTIQQANTRSKGLIEIGDGNIPFLHYLVNNAKMAGYLNIYMVIGENDTLFQEVYGKKERENNFKGLIISFVRQYIPDGRVKPFGTADGVFQALEQYPTLRSSMFTVCNCDNLYSKNILAALRKTKAPNALAGYDRDSLKYTTERIARFALMKVGQDNSLIDIIEKPSDEEVLNYYDTEEKLRVSMNIFRFNGDLFYPFLQNCPVHPQRNEKELPTALLNMVNEIPRSVEVIPISEHVIDLTSKEDIATVNEYLKKHYPNGLDWK